jgi:hypothetical protein
MNFKKSIILISILMISSLLLFTNIVFAEDTETQNKDADEGFYPTIIDKKQSLKFNGNTEQGKPLPESEITRVKFSKDWVIKNDIDPNPVSIKITFPAAWIEKSPILIEDEISVELIVPTNILNCHNTSKNTEEITVVFPYYYFTNYPSPVFPTSPEIEDIKSTKNGGLKDIEYEQRIRYAATSGDYILGAAGTVRPYTYENDADETFVAYHEIETYGAINDCIEIISDMETTEASTKVWYAIWNNHNNVFSGGNVRIYVDVGDSVYYEWWLNTGYYNLYLYYDGDWYGDYFYDSTPSSYFDVFKGSSELDPIGGITEEFFVYTNPVSIIDLYTDNWNGASYVNQRLDYDSSSSDEDYVGIASSIGSTG